MNEEILKKIDKEISFLDCSGSYEGGIKRGFEITKEIIQSNSGWIPFTSIFDRDENMEMLNCNIPDDGQDIIVTDGKIVWADTFMRDGIECYLDGGRELCSEVIAWQPLPAPYQPKGE